MRFCDLPQTGIVLEDVVVAQRVEAPGSCIGSEIRGQGEFVEEFCEFVGEVEGCREGMLDVVEGEVASVMR